MIKSFKAFLLCLLSSSFFLIPYFMYFYKIKTKFHASGQPFHTFSPPIDAIEVFNTTGILRLSPDMDVLVAIDATLQVVAKDFIFLESPVSRYPH